MSQRPIGVYGTVKRYNAEIGIRSALGQGTTFSIQLPAPTRVDARLAPAPQQVPTGLRLLIIDDDALLLKTLRET